MAVTKVCCTCLAFDVELFSLADVEIRGYFEKAISNIKMEPGEELMQDVCGKCVFLMRKYVKFKETCLEANQRLRQLSLQSPYISVSQLESERRKLYSETTISFDEIPVIPNTINFDKVPIIPDTISFDEIPIIPDTQIRLVQVKQEDLKDEIPLKMDLEDPEKNYESLPHSNMHSFDEGKTLIKEDVIAVKQISIESNLNIEENPLQTHEDEKYFEKSLKKRTLRGCTKKNTSLLNKKQALWKSDYAVQVTLTEEQQKEESLKRETSETYLKAPFKCTHCVMGFVSIDKFDQHMECHKESRGALECDLCKLRYCNLRRLQIHQRSHKIRYKCLTCGELTMTQKQAIRHKKRQHLGIKFECKHCDAKFKSPEYYKLHTRTAHPTKHVCDLCGYYFTSQEKLDIHKNTINDCRKSRQIVFECKTCDIRFLKLHSWYRHMLNHANDKEQSPPAECLICGYKNAAWSDWRNHILSEHRNKADEKNAACICDVCGKTLATKGNLSSHIRIKHKETISAGFKGRFSEDTCKICDLHIQRCNMKRHMLTHTGEKKYACDVCGKRFNRAITRNDHVQNVHRKMDVADVNKAAADNAAPNVWQEECKVCKKIIRRDNMKRHLSTHTGEKPYECEICGNCFTQATSRNNHIRIVHKMAATSGEQDNSASSKDIPCPLCAKFFVSRAKLAAHERSHTGEKPFPCDVCKRSFATKQSLAVHRLRHAGETYPCDICHRTFDTQYYLKIHRETHTREKTHECDICERKFVTKSVLKIHRQRHNDEILPFTCNICDRSFNDKSNFLRHGLVHSSAKNWTCDLCGKTFKQSCSLKLHTKTVHLKLPHPPRKPRKKK